MPKCRRNCWVVSYIKMPKSRRNCCVVGCYNTQENTTNVQFYRFPGKPWEKERKEKWIAAVNRTIKGTNKPWTPTPNSQICSAHFAGGVKSNDPRKEAYNPTKFQTLYKKKRERVSNRKRRTEAHRQQADCFGAAANAGRTSDKCSSSVQVCSVSTQSDYFEETGHEHQDGIPIFFCWQDGNDAAVQACLPLSNNYGSVRGELKIRNNLSKPATRNVAVGPDCEIKLGFVGYENVSSDEVMKQLGGINIAFFNILLQFITPGKDGQPQYFKKVSREDRLLIFLMKMKLGLTFSAIGCIFRVSAITASTIFNAVLQTLIANTKSWIFWPSKAVVQLTLPKLFKSYPNCRAIIDCIELRCDTPLSVEQRVLMYSNYKGGYTIKYLIAMSPCGMVIFLSKGYGGRASDGFITNDSGFLTLVEEGDVIMADKGFPQIRMNLLQKKCALVMPPFCIKNQFTESEVDESYDTAAIRIHFERAVRLVKTFRILDHVTNDLFPYIDDIMYICCVLENKKTCH